MSFPIERLTSNKEPLFPRVRSGTEFFAQALPDLRRLLEECLRIQKERTGDSLMALGQQTERVRSASVGSLDTHKLDRQLRRLREAQRAHGQESQLLSIELAPLARCLSDLRDGIAHAFRHDRSETGEQIRGMGKELSPPATLDTLAETTVMLARLLDAGKELLRARTGGGEPHWESSLKERLEVRIRWMIRRDMPEVLAVEDASFKFPWNDDDFIRYLRQRNCIGVVAEREERGASNEKMEGRIIGTIVYELHERSIHVLDFAVAPDCRRKRVGSQMVEKLLSKLSPSGRQFLSFEVPLTEAAQAAPFLSSHDIHPKQRTPSPGTRTVRFESKPVQKLEEAEGRKHVELSPRTITIHTPQEARGEWAILLRKESAERDTACTTTLPTAQEGAEEIDVLPQSVVTLTPQEAFEGAQPAQTKAQEEGKQA